MNFIYQIRSKVSGRLNKEETSAEAVESFLKERNPSAYDIYRLEPLSKEIRSITSGKKWMEGQEDAKLV